ncbi:DedA family protein [Aquihabitans sp. G128]|uniref:DedA family protein n=1 Tax=Aquihabitans sp. G128 TaxID=2849779 RepID=UPI001C211C43|nr:DedA family protein [Aquihabitans sp. G128]QXC60000.1 DedA family protein [Aquihabitans sp. G128]
MTWLQGLDPVVIYAVIAVLSMLESAALTGLVIPGDTALLVAAAVLAESGGGSPVVLVLVAAGGAIVGDSIGYEIGRALRHRDHGRLRRLVASPSWHRAESMVERHGALSIVGGRFLAVVRTIVPVVAGSSGMRYRRFLGANVVGAVAWAALHVTIGTLAADSLTAVEGASRWLSLGALAAIAVVLVVRHLRRRARTAAGEGAPAVSDAATAQAEVTIDLTLATPPATTVGPHAGSTVRAGRCDRAKARAAAQAGSATDA